VHGIRVVEPNVTSSSRNTWGGVIVELIDVEISEFTRRSRSFLVTHEATGLARSLEYGERVLVNTGEDYRTAVVADIDHDQEHAYYRLVLGGLVPAGIALDGMRDGAARLSGRVSVHDVGDVLAHAREGRRIPMQRSSSESLLDR
jgi:hypothetical protein